MIFGFLSTTPASGLRAESSVSTRRWRAVARIAEPDLSGAVRLEAEGLIEGEGRRRNRSTSGSTGSPRKGDVELQAWIEGLIDYLAGARSGARATHPAGEIGTRGRSAPTAASSRALSEALSLWRQHFDAMMDGTHPRLQARRPGRAASEHGLIAGLKRIAVEGNMRRAELEIAWPTPRWRGSIDSRRSRATTKHQRNELARQESVAPLASWQPQRRDNGWRAHQRSQSSAPASAASRPPARYSCVASTLPSTSRRRASARSAAVLVMTPNAMKALRSLAVEEAVLAASFCRQGPCCAKLAQRSYHRQRRRSMLIAIISAPSFCTMHRGDLQEILREAVGDEHIHLRARCVAVSSDSTGARAASRMAKRSKPMW